MRSLDKKQHQQADSDQHRCNRTRDFKLAEVIGHDGQSVIEIAQILYGERRHALCQDHAVDDADAQPENRNNGKEKNSPLEQRCQH